MGRTKSFIKNISIDTAKRKHHCKHDKKHIVNIGDKRLKYKEGQSCSYFCIKCAEESLKNDISKLNNLLIELENAHS
jgi:superfamily II helicase